MAANQARLHNATDADEWSVELLAFGWVSVSGSVRGESDSEGASDITVWELDGVTQVDVGERGEVSLENETGAPVDLLVELANTSGVPRNNPLRHALSDDAWAAGGRPSESARRVMPASSLFPHAGTSPLPVQRTPLVGRCDVGGGGSGGGRDGGSIEQRGLCRAPGGDLETVGSNQDPLSIGRRREQDGAGIGEGVPHMLGCGERTGQRCRSIRYDPVPMVGEDGGRSQGCEVRLERLAGVGQ